MLYAYEENGTAHLACPKCLESGIVQDFNVETATVAHSHPKQGQLVRCDYCKDQHILIVPRKPKISDPKTILSLSIPTSLKNRITDKCKATGQNITSLVYPLLLPVLEKEFPANDDLDVE